MQRSDAIKKLLETKTHADLASLYSKNMEVQFNVAQDGGERIEEDYKGRPFHSYTDGINKWNHFRIPRNAKTDPVDNDCSVHTDLYQHAEGIGMTGWDWQNRLSRWVGFDFDAMTGHSDKHQKKMTDSELQQLREVVSAIPWITIRLSTSGKGIHLYVFLEPVETQNHTEHAALARAILGLMASITGFDFQTKVDAIGGNLWVWHRKMAGTNGLSLIKQGETLKDIPQNWRDHIRVVSGAGRRTLPAFITENKEANPNLEELFEEVTGAKTLIPLDAEHKRLLNFLYENKACAWWDQDHSMAVTHTVHLKEAYEKLDLKGVFKTNAKGENYGSDHNCFSGDTEVLTFDGIKTFNELNEIGHAKLYVLTESGMDWIDCEIQQFGTQAICEVDVGTDFKINTTWGHEWLYINGKDKISRTTTRNLHKNRLPVAGQELPEPSMEGYAHGFVFGDGWNIHQGETSDVAFHGGKNDLFPLISKFGNPGSLKSSNGAYVNCVRDLPYQWKLLPKNPTKEYALGFILGLFSADGNFAKSTFFISQSDLEALDTIRKWCHWLGFYFRSIRELDTQSVWATKQAYGLYLSTWNLKPEYLLRRDQREQLTITRQPQTMRVKHVTDLNKSEKVFCAIVPKYHNFTLANGIITGNCFMYPLRRGAWVVRRYTPGVAEESTWTQDNQGWTRCYLNRDLDLATACRTFNANEDESGGYIFREAEVAAQAAALLGINLGVPDWARTRETLIKKSKDGKFIVQMAATDQDDVRLMTEWNRKGKKWSRVLSGKTETLPETEGRNYDEVCRHIISSAHSNLGWLLRAEKEWIDETLTHVNAGLKGIVGKQTLVDVIIGEAVLKPWKIVCRPFEPEYPKVQGREWNRNAPQLRFRPTNADTLSYPTWLKILTHCGRSLNEPIKKNVWARGAGILTGADYLKVWLASLFQEPMAPLPYLFFHGPQDSGKSIFHESIRDCLITSGVVRADTALTNQQGFNGELENAILGVIEETNMKKNKVAYNRIKDWVTTGELTIHRKGKTPYSVINYLKLIQTSNDYDAVPVMEGDTRIVMMYVDELAPTDKIPKKLFMQLLQKEAADFIAELLRVEIPESNDRLNVPVIATEEKIRAQQASQSYLEMFLSEKCYHVPGEMILFSEFVHDFQEWLPGNERDNWNMKAISQCLPHQYVKGRHTTTNQVMIGNISKNKDAKPKTVLVIRNEKLVGVTND